MQEPVLEIDITQKPPAGWGYLYKVTSPSGRSYIGKTHKSVSLRWYGHAHSGGQHTCSALHNAIAKYSPESFTVVVLAMLPISELCAAERNAIVVRGTRAPNGYNLTDGGDGVPGCYRSPESRRKQSIAMAGRKSTPEAVAKVVAALLRRGPPSEETRKRIALAHTGVKHSPERCKANGDGHRGLVQSEETRAKRSRSLTGIKRSPETRRRMAIAQTGKIVSEETRKKQSMAQKIRYERACLEKASRFPVALRIREDV